MPLASYRLSYYPPLLRGFYLYGGGKTGERITARTLSLEVPPYKTQERSNLQHAGIRMDTKITHNMPNTILKKQAYSPSCERSKRYSDNWQDKNRQKKGNCITHYNPPSFDPKETTLTIVIYSLHHPKLTVPVLFCFVWWRHK